MKDISSYIKENPHFIKLELDLLNKNRAKYHEDSNFLQCKHQITDNKDQTSQVLKSFEYKTNNPEKCIKSNCSNIVTTVYNKSYLEELSNKLNKNNGLNKENTKSRSKSSIKHKNTTEVINNNPSKYPKRGVISNYKQNNFQQVNNKLNSKVVNHNRVLVNVKEKPAMYKIVQKLVEKESKVTKFFIYKTLQRKAFIFKLIKKRFFIVKKLSNNQKLAKAKVFEILYKNYFKEKQINLKLNNYFTMKLKYKAYNIIKLFYLSKFYSKLNMKRQIQFEYKQFIKNSITSIVNKTQSHNSIIKFILITIKTLIARRVSLKTKIYNFINSKKTKLYKSFYNTIVESLVNNENLRLQNKSFYRRIFIGKLSLIRNIKDNFYEKLVMKKFIFYFKVFLKKMNFTLKKKNKIIIANLFYNDNLKSKSYFGIQRCLNRKHKIIKFMHMWIKTSKYNFAINIKNEYMSLSHLNLLQQKYILHKAKSFFYQFINICTNEVGIKKKINLHSINNKLKIFRNILLGLKKNLYKKCRLQSFLKVYKKEYTENIKKRFLNKSIAAILPHYYLFDTNRNNNSNKNKNNLINTLTSTHLNNLLCIKNSESISNKICNNLYLNKLKMFILNNIFITFINKCKKNSKNRSIMNSKIAVCNYYYKNKLKINAFKLVQINFSNNKFFKFTLKHYVNKLYSITTRIKKEKEKFKHLKKIIKFNNYTFKHIIK